MHLSRHHEPGDGSMAQLLFFSWDSPGNPWLGGGGVNRDREMLSRYTQSFDRVILYVGAHPHSQRTTIDGIEIIPLGFGPNEWVSRILYIVLSNLLILMSLAKPNTTLGCTLSPYSPFPAAALHPRHFGILHHTILDSWIKKIGPWAGSILSFLEGKYYCLFKRIVVINSDVQEWVKSQNPQADVLLSANACDQDLLDLQPNPNPIPQILFFGRIDRFMKGIDLLLHAFAKILPQNPQVQLVLGGRMASPADRQSTLDLIEELGLKQSVLIHENPSETLKRELLAQACFFASPSRFEGWGIAALEACSAGLAVVVSDASGFRTSIAPGDCGIMVPKGDIEALALALQTMLAQPQLRQDYGIKARNWARNFNWPQIAQTELQWILNPKA